MEVVAPVVHANTVQVVVDVLSVGSLSFALAEAETDDFALGRLPTATQLEVQVVQTGLVIGLVRNIGPPIRGRAESPLDRADGLRRGGAGRGSDSRVGNRRVSEGVAVPGAEGAGQCHVLARGTRIRDRYLVGQRVVGDTGFHERVADVDIGVHVQERRAEDALWNVV